MQVASVRRQSSARAIRAWVVVSCAGLALGVAACQRPAPTDRGDGTPGPAAGDAASRRTIVDLRGNRVEIPRRPSRVALFGGPSGQIAFILGAQDSLVAVTNTLRTSRLVAEMDPRIATLPGPRTTNGSVNVEELIAANPELVVAGDIDGDIVRRKTRIPVVNFADSMDEGYEATIREVRFYGEVFGVPERAERYVRYLEETMARLRARTEGIPEGERAVVFNGYDPSHLVTLGGDTFLDERVRLAGCRNAAAGVRTVGKREGLHSGLGEVSMEEVLAWNPDLIVINHGTPADLAAAPTWQHVEAVRRSRVHVQPAGIFIWNRPTAESAVLYPLWLATIAYPDRFRDVDMVAEVKRFYAEICEWSLSDAQAARVLAGDYESRIMRGAVR